MFVKRSCKPELITNLNSLDVEEDIELLPQESKGLGIIYHLMLYFIQVL